jgi:hypothetical protein
MTKKQSKFRVIKVVAYTIWHTDDEDDYAGPYDYFSTRGEAEEAARQLNMEEKP